MVLSTYPQNLTVLIKYILLLTLKFNNTTIAISLFLPPPFLFQQMSDPYFLWKKFYRANIPFENI